jgi:dTDP-4-dehydrorhamnose reductase
MGPVMREARRPKLLLIGSRGQVGWELARTLLPLGDVQALDRMSLDLSDLSAVRDAIRTARPDVVVNAAAYTQVDRAEQERELATRVNGEAPGVMAEAACRAGALLVHFSTDYVFDGAATTPYSEDDETGPRSVYGESKRIGDAAALATTAEVYIFRVGWVYGRRGRNFLNSIRRLAQERDELRVVADQVGAPTWSRAIAEATTLALGQLLMQRRAGLPRAPRGVYHMAPPDHTTWHGFASEILARTSPTLGRTPPTITAISTSEYPTAATRPAWSALDSSRLSAVFGLGLPSWREQLGLCLGSEE